MEALFLIIDQVNLYDSPVLELVQCPKVHSNYDLNLFVPGMILYRDLNRSSNLVEYWCLSVGS